MLFWSLSVGSVPSPKSVASWVLCRGLGKTLDEMTVTIPYDLYVFGTQENSVCDREWVESLRAVLKEHTELDYKPVRKYFNKQRLNVIKHITFFDYICVILLAHIYQVGRGRESEER